MDGVTENIRLRHAAHCYKADPEYGDRLAAALVVDVERVHELAAMTHEERMAATGQQVPARKIGGECAPSATRLKGARHVSGAT